MAQASRDALAEVDGCILTGGMLNIIGDRNFLLGCGERLLGGIGLGDGLRKAIDAVGVIRGGACAERKRPQNNNAEIKPSNSSDHRHRPCPGYAVETEIIVPLAA